MEDEVEKVEEGLKELFARSGIGARAGQEGILFDLGGGTGDVATTAGPSIAPVTSTDVKASALTMPSVDYDVLPPPGSFVSPSLPLYITHICF